jgi:hypothetical protein
MLINEARKYLDSNKLKEATGQRRGHPIRVRDGEVI